MEEDIKCKITPRITKVIVGIISKLSTLQDILNEDGSEESIRHIQEIGSMMEYLLSHFSDNPGIYMELVNEQEIDYLILAVESNIGTGYHGILPDGRSFNFRILKNKKPYRMLTLYSFSQWLDNGMEMILKKVFKDKKWVVERALQKDVDIMHFIEEM